ncbi:hypothetical protein CK227_10295 [Mesorhizobium sp. WSM4308]|uniref:hypothetical protein n=1 Tax=Mesorhizobium sp. WSM4308 TaxID=2029409 RepID=UPI000BB074D0|nr:hypothetical protein [Mesorhizobium sp. WSM4308]PBB75173.1 hypothetical protein CK227_10295 [Mesorhizobium sp. WSM4308]
MTADEKTAHTFTPGPWLSQGICYEGEERGSCGIIGDNLGGLVGVALPWPTELDEGNFPRVEANARLIAAAPEMLAALKQLEAEMRAGFGSSVGETREQVRRAIAKATGADQ